MEIAVVHLDFKISMLILKLMKQKKIKKYTAQQELKKSVRNSNFSGYNQIDST